MFPVRAVSAAVRHVEASAGSLVARAALPVAASFHTVYSTSVPRIPREIIKSLEVVSAARGERAHARDFSIAAVSLAALSGITASCAGSSSEKDTSPAGLGESLGWIPILSSGEKLEEKLRELKAHPRYNEISAADLEEALLIFRNFSMHHKEGKTTEERARLEQDVIFVREIYAHPNFKYLTSAGIEKILKEITWFSNSYPSDIFIPLLVHPNISKDTLVTAFKNFVADYPNKDLVNVILASSKMAGLSSAQLGDMLIEASYKGSAEMIEKICSHPRAYEISAKDLGNALSCASINNNDHAFRAIAGHPGFTEIESSHLGWSLECYASHDNLAAVKVLLSTHKITSKSLAGALGECVEKGFYESAKEIIESSVQHTSFEDLSPIMKYLACTLSVEKNRELFKMLLETPQCQNAPVSFVEEVFNIARSRFSNRADYPDVLKLMSKFVNFKHVVVK